MKKKIDPNVEAIREKLKDRAIFGLKKYGVDTTRPDLTHLQWLEHAQAEALDFAVYLQVLIGKEQAQVKKLNEILDCAFIPKRN